MEETTGRPRREWEGNIKMGVKYGLGCGPDSYAIELDPAVGIVK